MTCYQPLLVLYALHSIPVLGPHVIHVWLDGFSSYAENETLYLVYFSKRGPEYLSSVSVNKLNIVPSYIHTDL